MANKRRAKKTRAPYKRYVYKSNYVGDNSSDEEVEEEDEVEQPGTVGGYDLYGNTKNSFNKNNLRVTSFYVLTDTKKDNSFQGKIWPKSKFEKIDVLHCCLNGRLIEAEEEELIMDNSMVLPVEIIVRILAILNLRGKLKPKFLRVCKLFYAIALPMLYYRPHIKATNFFAFMDTISNNKTIGNNIHLLDLSYVIQSGKNAFVAKLLKRSSKSLEEFISPQTSFGFGPLMAIKSCQQLKVLDLRLVSETVNLKELFASLKNLSHLQHLSFPRSSIEMENFDDIESVQWPPNLSFLRLSGGISDEFLLRTSIPSTIKMLEFAHCPLINDSAFHHILGRHGSNLTSLKVQFPMPGLKSNSMDYVFTYCPNLISLEIAVDYASNTIFDEENLPFMPHPRPLRSMYINSSGMLGTSNKLEPIDLAIAMNEGRLPELKNLNVTAKLGWDPKSDYVNFIVEELDERLGGLYIGY